MKRSAHTQLKGRIFGVTRGSDTVFTLITNGAVDALYLAVGKEADAVIKASGVMVVAG